MAEGGGRALWFVLIALCVVLVVVFAIRNLPGPAESPPEELLDRALTAPTPEEQEAAAIELGQRGFDQVELCRRLFAESKTPEVRAVMAQNLGNFIDVDSMPQLLDAMEDENELVRDRAGIAVQAISGMDKGFSGDAPLAERQAAVTFYRKFWKEAQPPSRFIEIAREKAQKKAADEKAAAASKEQN